MAKRVKRFSRGLNSFLYRPGYGFPPKSDKIIVNKFEGPEKYSVRRLPSGDYEVLDLNTGKPAASQMDSRNEAEEWIKGQS